MEAVPRPVDDDGAAMRRGLRDLHRGLLSELERLEVLLEIPQQERESPEAGLNGKAILTDDFAEGPPGGAAAAVDGGGRGGRLGGPRRQKCPGLPFSPTELPPPPDAGGKPEPPPLFQCTVPQVPRPPSPGSRPPTPGLAEAPGLPVAVTPPSSGEVLALKFSARGLETVAELPPPPLQPRIPPEPPNFAEKDSRVSGASLSRSLPGRDTPIPATPITQSSELGGRITTSSGLADLGGRNTGSGKNLLKNSRTTSLQAYPNLYLDNCTPMSGDLTHYKKTWEMEKRKKELLRTKSLVAREPKTASQIIKETAYHHYFETFFAVVILSSAVVYGAEVLYQAHNPTEPEPLGFFVMHQAFTILFLFELSIRMYSIGLRTFLFGKEHWVWGWLDVLVCSASVLESVLGTYLLAMANGGQSVDTDPVRIMRMVRVLRVSRAFRLQRFMWYVGSLRTLVYSIAATLKSLFWAMVLLLTIVFLFAMSFTQFTIDFSNDPHADPLVVQEMREYWGTLDRSMLTLFQSIAGGLSWREAALPMAEVSLFIVFLFIIYISFVLFAVLNVVTGVFCSSAIETTSHTPDLVARSLIDNQHVYEEELRRLFHSIDVGETGLITLSEFESLQGDEMALAYFRALEIDFEDAWSIFKLMDKDKGGAIEIDEFVRGCQQLRGGASSVAMKEVSSDVRRLIEYMHKAVDKTEQRFDQLATEFRSVAALDQFAKRMGTALMS